MLLAAGGYSNGPVETAARLARDRARVVDIGKTQLDLPWNAYYDKELDVRFSRSYGPGRYDDRYELEGIDYPAGYVRWTERRNLGCFLDLLANGSVDVASLVSGIHPVTDAVDVYERLSGGDLAGVGFLFAYPRPPDDDERPAPAAHAPAPSRTEPRTEPRPRPALSPGRDPGRGGPVRLGFIGAGNYATSMLLPHLADDPGTDLAQRRDHHARCRRVNAQRAFGFTTRQHRRRQPSSTTTRSTPSSSSPVTTPTPGSCAAPSNAGKAVFVEKPLALTKEELDAILDTVVDTGNDRLMVGFNRRFAPLFAASARRLPGPAGTAARPATSSTPVRLAAGSWYLNEGLEGSRFTGEGGHFVDTVSALAGQDPVEVFAAGGGADLHVTLRYPDGSVGTISYVTTGCPRFPKETLDVHADGRTARLDDFRRTTVWSGRARRVKRSLTGPDKGQQAQLARFVEAVRAGAPMPVELGSLIATTAATLAATTSLATRRPVGL